MNDVLTFRCQMKSRNDGFTFRCLTKSENEVFTFPNLYYRAFLTPWNIAFFRLAHSITKRGVERKTKRA